MLCLLVIDMLNDYLDRWPDRQRQDLIEATNALVDAARRKHHKIIWVRQAFKEDLSDAFLEMRDKQIKMTIEGTRGAEIHAGLHREASDPVILKKRYSAFFQTELDDLLGMLSPEGLILAGLNTHACIRMAAIDAYQRDYRVVLATDCIGSQDTRHADVTLDYLRDKIARLQTNDEIIPAL